MQNRWSSAGAAEYVSRYAEAWGEDLALKAYASVLIGREERLVLHGGGNSSLKGWYGNVLGERIGALYVKPSGFDMARMEPGHFTVLDLGYLRRLRSLQDLPDERMCSEFQTHMLVPGGAPPSIETLVHAFVPKRFLDHCHADAILALTNQPNGERLVSEALGPGVLVLRYEKPGFRLAQAAAACYDEAPASRAMVWMRHGLLTWGDNARESYDTTIELITRAEDYIAHHARKRSVAAVGTSVETAQARLEQLAPVVRGQLAVASADADRPHRRVVLQSLVNREILDFLDSDWSREVALTPPLTADHLIHTKALPLWLGGAQFNDAEAFRAQVVGAVGGYRAAYEDYLARNQGAEDFSPMDSSPRVVLIPGMGALCAGSNLRSARITRDITAHTLAVKAQMAAMGGYQGSGERDLFEMEYHPFQRAKLGLERGQPLSRQTALITGAAGAIGSAIAEELLASGCQVAVTDLPGENLDTALETLRRSFGDRVVAVPLDVTDPTSVRAGFAAATREWGGVDLVIVNAGVALVCSLEEMSVEAFRKLERVNVEGTLLVLSEAARHFRLQGTGGDVVLISTKNVFAPGARFGAYSATKSAAHQLARIASLEFAELGVRVNMVAPDAVFSHGERKSGLWETVGPDRMKARGLDAHGLEEYYRSRNLLKARVTGRHVARATLFFALRETPTTGATIPVDGGLPDSTPR